MRASTRRAAFRPELASGRGLRVYGIGYKAGNPRRQLIRESCAIADTQACRKLRAAVLKRIADMRSRPPRTARSAR